MRPEILAAMRREEMEKEYRRRLRKRMHREREVRPLDPLLVYDGDPIGFITEHLGQCVGDSWRNWRTVLKAAFGKPLDAEELAFFRTIADRDPPRRRVRELWTIIGRRGGKDSVASLIAAHAAIYADVSRLRPGEFPLVACFATDRVQALIVANYIRGLFAGNAAMKARLVGGELPEGHQTPLRLINGVEVAVMTNNFRAPRGRAIVAAIFDECLVAGTLVETDRGSRAIEGVRSGDLVWTRGGLRLVLEQRLTCLDAELWQVNFSDGRSLIGTANHPVFVVNQGFVPLYSLQAEDEVFEWSRDFALTVEPESVRMPSGATPVQRGSGFGGKSCCPLMVTVLLNGVVNVGTSVKTVTLRIGKESFFTEKPTWQSMVTCLKRLRYTTKTRIRRIFRSITWKRLLLKSILKGMVFEASVLGSTRNYRSICAKVVESIGIIGSQLRSYAKDAAWYFQPPECVPCFALQGAGLSFIKSKTQRDLEQGIERFTVNGITRKEINTLRVTNVSKSNVPGQVYNLSVEGEEEYFANGVLVHNCAFWKSEESTTPDIETYTAVLPGMAMVPGAMLIGISSPHMQKGLVYDKWRKFYGQDDDNVLVVRAPTRTMNPRIDDINPGLIDEAVEDDPERARAEYFAEWRRDLADFVPRDVVESLVVRKRYELPRIEGVEYRAFFDASGGTSDSATLGIAHREANGRGVLDCLREVRPPFDPGSVIADFATTLRDYGVSSVLADRYAGSFPVAEFAKHGIAQIPTEKSKSEIYLAFLPLLMGHDRVELLDNRRLVDQLCSLERRTVRAGRDSVDHPQGGHDDLANVAAGALTMVTGDEQVSLWSLASLA